MESKYILAIMLEYGEGGPKNKKRAGDLYIETAEAGVEEAFSSAAFYLKKRGTEDDKVRARYFLMKCIAKEQKPEDYFELGLMHENGEGGPVNLESAEQCYRISLEKGYALAQETLGAFLLEKDEKDALQEGKAMLLEAALKGSLYAQLNFSYFVVLEAEALDVLEEKDRAYFHSFKNNILTRASSSLKMRLFFMALDAYERREWEKSLACFSAAHFHGVFVRDELLADLHRKCEAIDGLAEVQDREDPERKLEFSASDEDIDHETNDLLFRPLSDEEASYLEETEELQEPFKKGIYPQKIKTIQEDITLNQVTLFFPNKKQKNFFKNFVYAENKMVLLEILNDIIANPLAGLGRPERLKGRYRGYVAYSRRLSKETRLVYAMLRRGELLILDAQGHYENRHKALDPNKFVSWKVTA